MKKIFSVIALMLIIFTNNTAVQADAEEVKQLDAMLEVSKSAFLATNDYSEIINNGLYAVATSRVEYYKQISDRIRKLSDSAPVGTVKRCAWFADMIVTERFNALDYFIKAMNCHSNGDSNG